MASSRFRARRLALLMVAGLALTGCAAEEPSSSASNGSSTPTDESAEAPAATEQPKAVEEPEESLAATPSECLVGTWAADNDKFAAQMASLAEGGGTVNSVSGDVTLTLAADGSTSTQYVGWTIDMTAEGQQIRLVRNGTDAGTYTVESDAHITMTEIATDSELAMFMNGAAAGTVPATNTLPLTSASFTCSDTSLAIVSPLTNVEFARQ